MLSRKGINMSFWGNLKKNFDSRLKGELVFIFHEGRCGSTILADLLDQHPKIKWAGEIYWLIYNSWKKKWLSHKGLPKGTVFHEDLLHELQKMKRGEISILPEGEDVFSIVEKKRETSFEKFLGIEIQSFELEPFNICFKDYIQKIKEKATCRFIILERRNQLRTAVSFAIALKNSQLHITSDQETKVTTVKIDPTSMILKARKMTLMEHLQETKKNYNHIKNVLEPESLLYLSYEDDIFSDPTLAYTRVCEFLDIPALQEEIFIRYNKTNPFPLKDIIENFEEIEKELSGTEFEWMLYE